MKTINATLAGLLLASGAHASQITLGNSTFGTYDFGGAPPASLTIASPGIGGAVSAFFPPDTGDYWFAGIAPFSAGPLAGGNFPTSGSQDFAVVMTDGDALLGVITWALLKDHSAHPDLDGTLSISNSIGDASWLADFPIGGQAEIDLALTLFPGPTLDEIATNGGGQWATISSGEIVPIPRSVSEPSTLAMLGAGLIGLFFWLRGKLV